MKTLAQIRAQNALKCIGQEFKGQVGGDVVNKIPSMIQNNGLMAALAFCFAKGGGHEKVTNLIAEHLSDESIGIVRAGNTEELIEELANGDATLLRRATAEAIAFLNYVKRFAK